MDAMQTLLKSMRLRGGVFLEGEFTAPWCITSQVTCEDCRPFMPDPAQIIAYHYISEGETVLRVGSAPPKVVRAGEVIILPRNDAHILGSSADLEPVLTDLLVENGEDGGLARIAFGGGGERTRLYCGFLGTDAPGSPLCEILPPAMTVSLEKAQSLWIESSIRFAAKKVSRRSEEHETIGSLAELVLAEAVRTYLQTVPAEESAWQSGLLDPMVARALVALHRAPDDFWTTEALAKHAGLSRSALVERFTRRVGMPPMRYLSRLRLNLASHRLEHSAEPISHIALAAGYDSEATFSRAFKRAFGAPPAAWRKSRPGRTVV